MRKVRSKDTKPEMVVRKLIFSMGYRYRLHDRKLPGTPDLVFPGRKKVIFVHGCFWHQHDGCKLARMPKSRMPFWTTKLSMNRERDDRNMAYLTELGWSVLVIWECQLQNPSRISDTVTRFLSEEHGTQDAVC